METPFDSPTTTEEKAERADRNSGHKKGNVLFPIKKEEGTATINGQILNFVEKFNCPCGFTYGREKNHEWMATLARVYKMRADQHFIYCECKAPIFEVNLTGTRTSVVGTSRGKFTAKNSPYPQMDAATDAAVLATVKFLKEQKKQFAEIATKISENERESGRKINALFNDLQKVAAYYARQTPGSKILSVDNFSFSPKDGIGCSRYHGSYADYSNARILYRMSELDNTQIDKMKIHPRLQNILRAYKLLYYYSEFFQNTRAYRSSPKDEMTTSDINQEINRLKEPNLNFEQSEPASWLSDKEKATYKNQPENRIRKMSINQRLKLIYNYADHHTRQQLALKSLIDVIERHFSREIFLFLRLREDRKKK